jgi:hypothetical protein
MIDEATDAAMNRLSELTDGGIEAIGADEAGRARRRERRPCRRGVDLKNKNQISAEPRSTPILRCNWCLGSGSHEKNQTHGG